MKKRFFLPLLFASLMVLGACANSGEAKRTNIDFDNLETNEYTPVFTKGTLGDFDLISPTNGLEVFTTPTFTWQECENAKTYTLEICENDRFISTVEYIVYDKIDNLTSTTFNIQADLANKNTTYYWRVTAHNDSDKPKQSTSTFTFYLKAQEVEEVNFDLGDADDWLLHPVGSYADVAIDNSNFFGNNKPALSITFKKEDTNQGIPSSDGWIIVTKTIERSCYGTDAIFFNFYYAGNDAKVFIRLVDKDNEYWFCEISVSNNAKQSIILKYDNFVQRLKDVPVANRQFDFERIKYMEVVFEKSFGDGACLISDVKAIKFNNYKDRFIDTLHFNEYDDSYWVNDNYQFVRTINGDELELAYSNTPIGDNEKGINGYGFAKLNVNKFFITGDAIKVNVKYTGKAGGNIIIRLYEEDSDRWVYRIPYNSIEPDVYTELVIPFMSFGKSEFNGDGKRQFSFFQNLQFGVENQTGAGSIFFKDFEIVRIEDYKTEQYRTVNTDGVIETFDSYNRNTELYFIWNVSTGNKDEFMSLNATTKTGGTANKQCAQFEYKTDMEPAEYILPLDVVDNNFSSLKLWLKDASIGEAKAKVDLIITLINGEKYVYTIEALDKAWYEYVVPFSMFELTNRLDVTGSPTPIGEGTITTIEIDLQYFTPSLFGISKPTYTDGNIVYVDEIAFTHSGNFSKTEKERIIRTDGTKALIEDAETYTSIDAVLDNWMIGSTYGYEGIELSNDVSSNGGNNSIKMQYKAKQSSINYFCPIKVNSDVAAKGISLDIKGDGKVTIYVNIYVEIGTTKYHYRTSLTNVEATWNQYRIGFDNFELIESSSAKKLSSSQVPNITRVSFGAVDSVSEEALSNFYIDNYYLDNTVTYTTNSKTAIM